ncbi:predicted protein [Naegleria gruberi]|uniref:Predicted protein n=1 Tax=Naegleria gruberi TaxID=5762 RepID=D2VB78_NAEGR|nr:uncharacterized protein NAEGRDRAFT_66120 [Naegleria gruberi]EFC45861.1 predicted protein [Naegleria gruberi]|eukprot:XP_002678605.1 predicted protein [Naegleria gruberi strain NEG-M]
MQALIDLYKKGIEEYNKGLSAYQANNFEQAVKSLEEGKQLFQKVLSTPIPEKFADKFKVASDHLLKTFELLLRSKYKLPNADFMEIQKGFIKLIRQNVSTGTFNEAKLLFLFQSYINCKTKAHKSPQEQPIFTIVEAIKEEAYEVHQIPFLKLELKAIEDTNCQDILFKENILVLQRLGEYLEKVSPNSSDIILYKVKRILLFLHSYSGTQPVSDSQVLKELEEVSSMLGTTIVNGNDTLTQTIIPFITNIITTFVSCMRYLERNPSNIEDLLSVNNSNETLNMKNKEIFSKVLKTVFNGHLQSIESLTRNLRFNLDVTDLFAHLNKRDIIYIFYLIGTVIRFCMVYGMDDVILNFRRIFSKPIPSNVDADYLKQYQTILSILNDHALHMNDKQFIKREKLDSFQEFEYRRRFCCKPEDDSFMQLSNEITGKILELSTEDAASISKYSYINCKAAMKYDVQVAYQHLIKSMKMRGMLEKEKRSEAKVIESITKKATKSDLKTSFSLAHHFDHSCISLLHYQQMIRIHEVRGNFSSCETCIRQGLRFSILVKCLSFTLSYLYHLARLKLNRHDFEDVEYIVQIVKALLSDNTSATHNIINKFAHEFLLLESTMLLMQNKDEEAETLLNSISNKNEMGIDLQKVILLLKRNDEQGAKQILERLSKVVDLNASNEKTEEDSLWVKYYCNALSGNNKLNYEFRSNFGLAWNDVPIPLKKRILAHMNTTSETTFTNNSEERDYAFLSSMSMGIRLKHTLQDLLDYFNSMNNNGMQSIGSMDDMTDNKGVEKMMRRLSITNELQFTFMLDLKDLTTKKSFMDNLISILPSNISVCNICITDDYSNLVVTVMNNHSGGDDDCIVMPIPLVRNTESFSKLNRLFSESAIKQTQLQYQKSSDSGSQLTSSSLSSYSNWRSYQALFGNDSNILHKVLLSFDHLQILSKESFTITDKSSWWKTRKDLDEKLATLVKYIEDLLFGPIKLLLVPRLMSEFDEILEAKTEFLIEKLKDVGGMVDFTFDPRMAKLLLKSFSSFKEESDVEECIKYFILGNVDCDASIVSSIQNIFYTTFLQAFSESDKKKDNLLFRHCTRIEKQKIKRKHLVFCLDKLIQQLPLEPRNWRKILQSTQDKETIEMLSNTIDGM